MTATAHTAYDTNQQHLETLRLAQGKLWARYESCEAVPHHFTVAWHSRRAAWILRQGVDCTAARLATHFLIARGLGQQRRYKKRVVRELLGSLVLHHHVGARLKNRLEKRMYGRWRTATS